MCLTGRAGPEFGRIRAARCAKNPFTRSIVERRHRIHRTRAGTARERPSRSTRGGQTFARLEEKTIRISHLVGDGFALRLLASLEARGDGRQLRAAVAGVYRHLDGDGARGRGHGRSVWWVPARVRSDRWRAGTFEVDTAVDIEIIEVKMLETRHLSYLRVRPGSLRVLRLLLPVAHRVVLLLRHHQPQLARRLHRLRPRAHLVDPAALLPRDGLVRV